MLTGIDIFTNGKYECTVSTGGEIDAPNVKRTEYTLLDLNEEGFLSLLAENGDVRDDLQIPSEPHLADTIAKIKKAVEEEEEITI